MKKRLLYSLLFFGYVFSQACQAASILDIDVGGVSSGEELSLSDSEINNFSLTKHGFTPKGTTTSGKYLRSDATWGTPLVDGIVTVENGGSGSNTAAGARANLGAAASGLNSDISGLDSLNKAPVVSGNSWSVSYDATETNIRGGISYKGRLYAGSGDTEGLVYVFDGTTWSVSYDSSEARIYCFEEFNGKLYAGTYPSGLIYVFDGTTWTTSYDSAETYIFVLKKYNDKLYAGSGANGLIYVFDGATWTTSYDSPSSEILALEEYNGKLYAGSVASGLVYVFDGATWTTSYDSTETSIYSLKEFNGKLYAGTYPGGLVYVFDGITWSLSYDSTETTIYCLEEYNDKLYAGSGASGLIYVFDGATWTTSYDSTETRISMLEEYNGKLYAGTNPSGLVYVFSDFLATLNYNRNRESIETQYHFWNKLQSFGSSVNFSALTASELVALDASNNLVSLPAATYPLPGELAYVKGVTSALQTQLNAKAPSNGATLTNVTITSGTMPSHQTLAGSGSTTIGVNENYTYTPQGTGKFIVSGSGGADFSGLDDGITLGTVTVNYSGFMNSARIRPFLFTECLHSSASALDPFAGIGILSGTLVSVAGSAQHPGVQRLTASTSADSGYYIRTGVNALLLAGGETCSVIFRLQSGTATTRIGFFDTATSTTPTDGACLTFAGTAIAYGINYNNGASSTTVSSYTASLNTWYRLDPTVNSDATSVTYTLYNEAGTVLWQDSVSGNIPTAVGRETAVGIISTSPGTDSAPLVDVDLIAVGFNRVLTR